MSILSNAGRDAGESAAKEIHQTVKDAIPQAQAVLDEVITRTANEIVTQAAGALTQAAGSLEIALGSFPEAFVAALEGFTVEISPITIKVTRK